LGGFPGIEPAKIFGSWIVARLRGGSFHEVKTLGSLGLLFIGCVTPGACGVYPGLR
jgi:hypothetical protein